MSKKKENQQSVTQDTNPNLLDGKNTVCWIKSIHPTQLAAFYFFARIVHYRLDSEDKLLRYSIGLTRQTFTFHVHTVGVRTNI